MFVHIIAQIYVCDDWYISFHSRAVTFGTAARI